MGQRYEKNKQNVSENKKTLEQLREDKDTIRNEYTPLRLLDSIQDLLDDEASEAIGEVQNVGEFENQRIDSETEVANEEKKQIADEINSEIVKLNSGLEKLRQTNGIEFGKSAVEKSSQEYKKQIEHFKDLIGELGEQPVESGSLHSGATEGTANIISDNTSDAPVPFKEGETILVMHSDSNDFLPNRLYPLGSSEYTAMIDSLRSSNVEYRPIEKYNGDRTQNDIINHLSGGDLTEGSCSSLALAYAGNKAGYNVLDFRDGDSRAFFSSRSSIHEVASLPNVQSITLNGTNDFETANQLLNSMQEGKEYYLATGQHASIVRRNGSSFEYLELQHPSDGNGWHNLNDYVLSNRFGCRSSHSSAFSNFLIDVDSLSNNHEFLSVLGYINTAESAQRKGGSGNVR